MNSGKKGVRKMREKSQVDDIDRSIYDIRDEEKDAYRMEEGLTPEIVDKLSKEKDDPVWMQQFRLQSLQIYNEMPVPNWDPPSMVWTLTILPPMYGRIPGCRDHGRMYHRISRIPLNDWESRRQSESP